MTTNEKRFYLNNLFKSESLYRCLLRAEKSKVISHHNFLKFHDLVIYRGKKDWWKNNNIILLINLFYEIVVNHQKSFKNRFIIKVHRKFWKVNPYDFTI